MVKRESAEQLTLHLWETHQGKLFVCPACPNPGEFSYSCTPLKRHVISRHKLKSEELIENIDLQYLIVKNSGRSSSTDKKSEVHKRSCNTQLLNKNITSTSKRKTGLGLRYFQQEKMATKINLLVELRNSGSLNPSNGAGDI